MRNSVLNTWKTKFYENPNRASLEGLATFTPATQLILPKENNLMRNFHITQGFLCEGCITQYEKEKLSSYYDDDESPDEELDVLGFDLNPDMDEETTCNFCTKKRKNSPAVCLNNGKPTCLDCLNGTSNSIEDSNLSSLNQILNDSNLLNNSQNDKKETYKRMMTDINTFTKISDRIKSSMDMRYDLSPTIAKGNKKVRTNISLNLNNVYDEENGVKPQLSTSSKRRSTIFEYSNKEINSKIMNLVSPRNSVDLKFRKNFNLNQIEKLCKSLEYIFENSSQRVTIHLPLIYEGLKTSNNSEWAEKLNSNGNFLFTFLNSKNDFLFGFVCNTFSEKKLGKLFKRVQDIGKSKIQIEYADQIFDTITIKKETILVEGQFVYDISNNKISFENTKLLKFLISPQTRQDLTSQIENFKIYDMC